MRPAPGEILALANWSPLAITRVAIGSQAAINLAVATGLLPAKGLPLPFVSYGGSNLVAVFVCMGLLGSVARHSAREQRDNRHSASPPGATQLALL